MTVDVRGGSIAGLSTTPPARLAVGELVAMLEAARPAWMRDALCREHPDVSWFRDRGESVSAPARAICGRCAVRDECRAFGIENEVPAGNGIWGGLGPDDRRRLRAETAA